MINNQIMSKRPPHQSSDGQHPQINHPSFNKSESIHLSQTKSPRTAKGQSPGQRHGSGVLRSGGEGVESSNQDERQKSGMGNQKSGIKQSDSPSVLKNRSKIGKRPISRVGEEGESNSSRLNQSSTKISKSKQLTLVTVKRIKRVHNPPMNSLNSAPPTGVKSGEGSVKTIKRTIVKYSRKPNTSGVENQIEDANEQRVDQGMVRKTIIKRIIKRISDPSRTHPPKDLSLPIKLENISDNAQEESSKKDQIGEDLKNQFKPIDFRKKMQQKDHQVWSKQSNFQGVWEKTAENQVCHFSFKIAHYPDEQRFVSFNKLQLDYNSRPFLDFYTLAYCAECSVPVYLMCLPENQIIQRIYIKRQKKDYLVFICDVCVHIKQSMESSDIDNQQEFDDRRREVECIECLNEGGYMKKLVGGKKDPVQFVHPICAISFPNIYQMGGPANMLIKHCQGIDRNKIYSIDQNHEAQDCDICCKKTRRVLKSSDTEGQSAHAFCIMNEIKERVFEEEVRMKNQDEQMEGRWSLQLFLKSTYNQGLDCFDKLGEDRESEQEEIESQSKFLRVIKTGQESRPQLCHCEVVSDDPENVVQCQACRNWYHHQCWGQNVDISKGGPSENYLQYLQKYKKTVKLTNHQNVEIEEESDLEESGESEEEDEESGDKRQEKEDFLLCDKCIQISNLTSKYESPDSTLGAFADILLNNTTIDAYLPGVTFSDETMCTSRKLIGLPPHDFRLMASCEFSLFEHVMLYKFWYKIIEQSLQRKLHVDLYRDLVQKSQVHIFNNQTLDLQVRKRIQEEVAIEGRFGQLQQTFFFREVFEPNSEQIGEEKVRYNTEEMTRLKSFINTNLRHHKVITLSTSYYYDKFIEGQIMLKFAKIYSSSAFDANEVRSFLRILRSLPSFSHQQSRSYGKLDSDYQVFRKWEERVVLQMNNADIKISQEKLVQKVKSFKDNDRSASGLSTVQFDYLSGVFQRKMSVSQVTELINEGSTFFVQNMSILLKLKKHLETAVRLGELTSSVEQYNKPVKTLLNHICNMGVCLVKPIDLNDILSIYRRSQDIRIKVKSFLSDEIVSNKLWLFELFQRGIEPDQMLRDKSKGQIQLRDRFRHLVFTIPQISELRSILVEKKDEFFIDKSLRDKAFEKIGLVMSLKGGRFEQIKSEAASKEEILNYLSLVDKYENVDLDHERTIAIQKLALLRLIQRSVDGKLNPEIADLRLQKNRSQSGKQDEVMTGGQQEEEQIKEDIRIAKQILVGTGKQEKKEVLKSEKVQIDESLIMDLIDPENTSVPLDSIIEKFQIKSTASFKLQKSSHSGSLKWGGKFMADQKAHSQEVKATDDEKQEEDDKKGGEDEVGIEQEDLMRAIKVLQNRQTDRVQFPLEQMMMLNAKFQVVLDLKREFQEILDSNGDSFNDQMILEMKKCVQKGWREHGLQMLKERNLIDNFKFSEDWFVNTYSKLKEACGGANALVNVDFKDFKQILSCVNSQSQLDSFMAVCKFNNQYFDKGGLATHHYREQQEKKSGRKGDIAQTKQLLICAAKNLHLSLLRCQWMIKVQRLLGIGKFANAKLSGGFQKYLRQSGDVKNQAFDFGQVCYLAQQAKDLELMEIIERQDDREKQDYGEVIRIFRPLCRYAATFISLFGLVMNEETEAEEGETGLKLILNTPKYLNQPFDKISAIINRCEHLEIIVKGINPDQDQFALHSIDFELKSLARTVEGLEYVEKTVRRLQEERESLGLEVVKKTIIQGLKRETNVSLDQILKLALTQINFSKNYYASRLKNPLSCKVTYAQSQQLLEDARDLFEFTKDTHIIQKLQQSLKAYDKFDRNYKDYISFKAALKEERESVEEDGVVWVEHKRQKEETFFTYEFVQELIASAHFIDIDIRGEKSGSQHFDIDGLEQDLLEFDNLIQENEEVLLQLEQELVNKQTQRAVEEIKSTEIFFKFEYFRIQLSWMSVYDEKIQSRIKAIQWVFTAFKLCSEGIIDPLSPFYVQINAAPGNGSSRRNLMSIKQWRDFAETSLKIGEIYPHLKYHAVIQQLQWQIHQAQDIVDFVQSKLQQQCVLQNVYLKGPKFYQQANLKQFNDFYFDKDMPTEDHKYRSQFDALDLPNPENNVRITEVLNSILKTPNRNGEMKLICPEISKERLRGYFDQKDRIEEFEEVRKRAEEININLYEEIRQLTKWIEDFNNLKGFKFISNHQIEQSGDELMEGQTEQKIIDKEQLYERLFKEHTVDQLTAFARQIFISPIHNLKLFLLLKKKIETAHQINDDLAEILKEQALQTQTQKSHVRVKISRIKPFTDHYLLNCNVQGLPVIKKVLEMLDSEREQLREIESEAQRLLNSKEVSDSERSDQLQQIQQKLQNLDIDFEEEEEKVGLILAVIKMEGMWRGMEGEEEDEDQICTGSQKAGDFQKLSLIQYKVVEALFNKAMSAKVIPSEHHLNDWFSRIRESVHNHIQFIKSASDAPSLDALKKQVEKDKISKLVDFNPLIAKKFQTFGQKDQESSESNQRRSRSSGSSDSSSQSNSSSDSSSNSVSSSNSQGTNSYSSSGSSNESSSEYSERREKPSREQEQERKRLLRLQKGQQQQIVFDPKRRKMIKVQGNKKKEEREEEVGEEGEDQMSSSKSEKSRSVSILDTEGVEDRRRDNKRIEKEFQKRHKEEQRLRMEGVKLLSQGIQRGEGETVNREEAFSDQQFSDIKKYFQNKKRNETLVELRKAVQDLIQTLDLLQELTKYLKESQEQVERKDIVKHIIKICKQIEEALYSKNLMKVDDEYMKKVTHALRNLKSLQSKNSDGSYKCKDFAFELLVREKILPIRLFYSQPQFQDYLESQIALIERKKSKQKNKEDVKVSANQSKKETLDQTKDRRDDEQGEIISQDSNLAKFSDNEDIMNFQKKPPTQTEKSIRSEEVLQLPRVTQIFNRAEVGSLLRVWRGKLDLQGFLNKQKDQFHAQAQLIHVDFLSTQDITVFQRIPNWPVSNMEDKDKTNVQGSLPFRGKTDVLEAQKHFRKLRQENRLVLKGVVRISDFPNLTIDQKFQTNDQMASHSRMLQNENKCSLFSLFEPVTQSNTQSGERHISEIKEVNIYLLPFCATTLEFLDEMGINPKEQGISEGQTAFAFLIHIRHNYYTMAERYILSKNKDISLNPTVLKHAQRPQPPLALRPNPGPTQYPQPPILPNQAFLQNAHLNFMSQSYVPPNPPMMFPPQPMQSTGYPLISAPQIPVIPYHGDPMISNQEQFDQKNFFQDNQEPDFQDIDMFDPLQGFDNFNPIPNPAFGRVPSPQDLIEKEIDDLIDYLRRSKAGHQQIMQALQPFILKQRPISAGGELKLEQFIKELIQQTQSQQQQMSGHF